jgi:hypothetical protein
VGFVVRFYDSDLAPVRADQVATEDIYHLFVPGEPSNRRMVYYSIEVDTTDVTVPEPEQAGHA